MRNLIATLLSILVILSHPFVGHPTDPQRVQYLLATVKVQELAMVVERYREDCGQYPLDLDALVKNPGVRGWSGPYWREIL